MLKKSPIIKLYLTIYDCPIWNWDKVKKTDDLRYLIRLKDYDELPDAEVSMDVWNDMQGEYMQHFKDMGTSGHYFDKYLDLQKTLRNEVIYSCDEYSPLLSKTVVRRKQMEQDLEAMPTISQTIEDQAVHMELFFDKAPGAFNTKLISVYRWYKYLQEHERRCNEIESIKETKA
jgi:hypothetical protein